MLKNMVKFVNLIVLTMEIVYDNNYNGFWRKSIRGDCGAS